MNTQLLLVLACLFGGVGQLFSTISWANTTEIWFYRCAPCHGDSGLGDGPAADLYWPPPRNFRDEPLRLGEKHVDIQRVISKGVKGTGMPAFENALSADDIAQLALKVQGLAVRRARTSSQRRPVTQQFGQMTNQGSILWKAKGCEGCHGDDGAGNPQVRSALRNENGVVSDLFDLRGHLKGGHAREDIFKAITLGRPGTPMVPRSDLTETERWALADHVLAIRTAQTKPRPRVVPKERPVRSRERLWTFRVGKLGRTVDTDTCISCHGRVHREFMESLHASARGAGVTGQYSYLDTAAVQRCDQCHSPTAIGHVDGSQSHKGLTCRSCHTNENGAVLTPRVDRHAVTQGMTSSKREPRMTRGDFCLPCHSLPLSLSVNGRPLLDTWREWAASVHFAQGIQCQNCHMPQGRHSFYGAHNPDQVRRAVHLSFGDLFETAARVRIPFEVKNIGAGHHFPTTATPAAVLLIYQGNKNGVVHETMQTWTIARLVHFQNGHWRELLDTRIPSGDSFANVYEWPIHPGAQWVEAELWFFPDHHYQGLYRTLIKTIGIHANDDLLKAMKTADSSAFLVTRIRRELEVRRP